MSLLEIIKDDYQRFPQNPTYEIYASDVYFADPMTQFNGLAKYQQMIKFISQWFLEIQLDLHEISQADQIIKTRWTLSWTAAVPWKPRISIPGRSELKINDQNLIASHIDYWDCSRLDVLKQFFNFFWAR